MKPHTQISSPRTSQSCTWGSPPAALGFPSQGRGSWADQFCLRGCLDLVQVQGLQSQPGRWDRRICCSLRHSKFYNNFTIILNLSIFATVYPYMYLIHIFILSIYLSIYLCWGGKQLQWILHRICFVHFIQYILKLFRVPASRVNQSINQSINQFRRLVKVVCQKIKRIIPKNIGFLLVPL